MYCEFRLRRNFVRFTPSNGHSEAHAGLPVVTRMYGPTVRCKGEFGDGQVVLRQCIRPRCGASLLRAMMGISAHSFSLADRPVAAFRVIRSRMRQQTVAPSLGSLSQTSVGSSSCSSSTQLSGLRRRRVWLRSGARQRARSRRYGPACWQAPQPGHCGAGVWTPPGARGRSCAWVSFQVSAK